MLGNILLSVWEFLRGKVTWMIIIILLLLIPLGYFAQKVEPDTNIETNLRTGSHDYDLIMEIKRTFSDQSILTLVRGKTVNEVMTPGNQDAMRYIADKVNNSEFSNKVRFVLSPTFFLDYMQGMGMYNPETMTPEDLILEPDGSINPQFKDLFMIAPPEKFDDPDWQRYTYIDENGQRQAYYHAMIPIGMWGSWDQEQMTDFIDFIEETVDDAGFDQTTWYLVTGLPVMMNWLGAETPKVLGVTMAIGAALMLILLTFGFKVLGRRPRRWLVVLLILASIVYTLGICGIFDVTLNNTSVVAFPILLGMSVDSCVQTHNRYDEEIRKGKTANEAARKAINRVVKALWYGMTLQIIGFASVFTVPSDQIHNFGITLIVGCAICMVIMLMFIVGILYKLDEGGDATRKPQPRHAGLVERLFAWMTPKLAKFGIPIIILGVILSGIGWWADEELPISQGFEDSVASDVQAYQDMNYLQVLSGGISPWNLVVKVKEGRSALEPEVLEWAHERSLVAKELGDPDKGHYIGAYSNIGTVFAEGFGGIPDSTEAAENMLTQFLPKEMWISLITEDRSAISVNFMNTSDKSDTCRDSMAILEEVFEGPNSMQPDAIDSVTITGLTVLGPIMDDNMDESREAIVTFGVGGMLIFCFLMFKFNWRRTIAVAFPVLMVLGWSSLYMYLLDFSANLMTGLLPVQMMAIGIELTIILLMRYYEERDKGEHPMLAMTTALSRIGRAVMISGGMIFAGFFAMIFAFDLVNVQDFGYVTMVDTILVAIAVLVVMPALVLTFDLKFRGGKIDAPVPDAEKLVSSTDETVEDLTS